MDNVFDLGLIVEITPNSSNGTCSNPVICVGTTNTIRCTNGSCDSSSNYSCTNRSGCGG